MAKRVRAVAKYKSGREEVFTGSVRADGTPEKKFQKKMEAYKSLETVIDIRVEAYDG